MIANLIRFLTLLRLVVAYQLDRLILPTSRCLSFWLWWLAPISSLQHRNTPAPQRLCQALIAMGPIYIKFGQALSTRVDLLSTEMALELAKLQDRVPPFATEEAEKLIQSQLKMPFHEVIQNLDAHPLGSASLAQVHAATLQSGEKVAIKLLRPGIKKRIQRDLKMLRSLAGWVDTCHPQRARLRAREVVQNYHDTLLDELNLTLEAGNMSQMRANFLEDTRLAIPQVNWELSTQDMLVTEEVSGATIAELPRLRKQGIDCNRLAKDGIALFLTQVFDHNFFHADMHPGNIMINTDNPARPNYILVDFGIVGVMSKEDLRYLAENLHAFFNRDYQKVADLHIESGWVEPSTNARAMAASVRAIGEPIYGKPLQEISFAEILLKLLQVAQEHQMIVQPQLLLLQKTLFQVEALARRLDDSIALPTIAEPIIKHWLQKEKGVYQGLERLANALPSWLEKIENCSQCHNTPSAYSQAQKNDHHVVAFTLGICLFVVLSYTILFI